MSSPPLVVRPRIIGQEKGRGRYTPAKAADDADVYFKNSLAAPFAAFSALVDPFSELSESLSFLLPAPFFPRGLLYGLFGFFP